MIVSQMNAFAARCCSSQATKVRHLRDRASDCALRINWCEGPSPSVVRQFARCHLAAQALEREHAYLCQTPDAPLTLDPG